MNDPRGPTPHWSLWSENDETRYPPYIRMPSQVSVVIGTAQGSGSMQGHGTVTSSVFAALTTHRKVEEQSAPPVEEPARILWSPIARMLMSPTQYRNVWLPHIADMHFERHECLKRRDKWGARWAVVRAHYYSVPKWVWWILAAPLLRPLLHWSSSFR